MEKLSEVAPGVIETTSVRLAMACVDGQSCCEGQTREGQGREAGEVETTPSKGYEDTTSKGTRFEMSLGFDLAPIPQASAVAYELEYATALGSTARRFSAACRAGARNETRKGVSD